MRFFSIKGVIVILATAVLLGAAPVVWAQETKPTPAPKPEYINSAITITKFRELSRKVGISREQFEAQTKVVKLSFAKDPLIAATVRLPKDWVQTSDRGMEIEQPSPSVLSLLDKYASPPIGDTHAYFQVKAVQVKYQLTAEQWFANHVVTEGLAVDGVRIISDRKVEAQFGRFENGRAFVVRAIALINGSRVIYAEYAIPASVYAKQKDLQIWAMLSFLPVNPSPDKIEQIETYSFLDLAEFNYPQSWTIRAPGLKNFDRMYAQVINTSSTEGFRSGDFEYLSLEGKIDVLILAKVEGTDLKAEVAFLRSDIESQKFELGEAMRVPKLSLRPEIRVMEANVYHLNDVQGGRQDYEYAFVVLDSPTYYYVITAFSQLQENDFMGWARNQEAFRMVAESVQ